MEWLILIIALLLLLVVITQQNKIDGLSLRLLDLSARMDLLERKLKGKLNA